MDNVQQNTALAHKLELATYRMEGRIQAASIDWRRAEVGSPQWEFARRTHRRRRLAAQRLFAAEMRTRRGA